MPVNGENKTKLEQVAELYNEGILPIEIAKKLNIGLTDVYSYMNVAKKKGILDINVRTLQDKIVELCNEGKSRKEIMEMFGITSQMLSINLSMANKKGLLNDEKMEEMILKKQKSTNSKIDITSKIKEMYENYIYPLDIADKLNITGKEVYDVIDNMPEEEQKRIRTKKIRENQMYTNIKEIMKNKGCKSTEAIDDLEFTIDSPNKRIELAKMNYLIGKIKSAKDILDDIVNDDEFSEEIRKKAEIQKRKIDLESRAMVIRKECKKAQDEGKSISYDYLCKRYSVRMKFVENIIGEEQREI